jgi:hypothetical protein
MTGFRYRGIWYTLYRGIPLPTGRTVAEHFAYLRRLIDLDKEES